MPNPRLEGQIWPLVVGCNNIVELELTLSLPSRFLARVALSQLPRLALGFLEITFRYC